MKKTVSLVSCVFVLSLLFLISGCNGNGAGSALSPAADPSQDPARETSLAAQKSWFERYQAGELAHLADSSKIVSGELADPRAPQSGRAFFSDATVRSVWDTLAEVPVDRLQEEFAAADARFATNFPPAGAPDRIMLEATEGLRWQIRGGINSFNFRSLAWLDFNGDGIMDLATGLPNAFQGIPKAGGYGLVMIYSGKFDPKNPDYSQIWFVWEPRLKYASGFGFSLAAADWNGDGLDDLVVGAPWGSSEAQSTKTTDPVGGNVYVYTSSLSRDASTDVHDGYTIPGQKPHGASEQIGWFGWSLARLGRSNDQRKDAIAIMSFNPYDAWGIIGRSSVSIYAQQTGGEVPAFEAGRLLPQQPDAVVLREDYLDGLGAGMFDQMGAANRVMTSAGDFNGDGFEDFAVSALVQIVNLGTQSERWNAGTLELFSGNITTTPGQSLGYLEGQQANMVLGVSPKGLSWDLDGQGDLVFTVAATASVSLLKGGATSGDLSSSIETLVSRPSDAGFGLELEPVGDYTGAGPTSRGGGGGSPGVKSTQDLLIAAPSMTYKGVPYAGGVFLFAGESRTIVREYHESKAGDGSPTPFAKKYGQVIATSSGFPGVGSFGLAFGTYAGIGHSDSIANLEVWAKESPLSTSKDLGRVAGPVGH